MYIRLSLDKEATKELTKLTQYINYQYGLFLSQLNENSGLGCHKFHITLLGGIRKKDEYKIRSVFNYLRGHHKFSILVEKFEVTRKGTVMLILKHKEIVQDIIKKIYPYIPNSRPYSSHIHITIGMYTGKDPKCFQRKLNDTILLNYYKWKVSGVEMDEEWDRNDHLNFI
jgi:hypothetical protein